MGKQIDPHLAKAKREIATVEKFLKQGYPPIGIVGSRAGISAVNMASKALKQGRLAFCGRVGSPTCVGLWFKKYKLKPDWSLFQERKADEIEVHREKQGQRDVLAENRRLRDALVEMQDIRAGLLKLTSEPLRPRYDAARVSPKSGSRTVIIHLSDWHCGEVVDIDEMEGLNSFNIEIFRKRVSRLTQAAIDLLTTHWKGKPPERLILIFGGDMITGELHELAKTNDALSAPAVRECVERLAGLTLELAKIAPVDVYSLPGNHGRLTHKPESKGMAVNNFDTLITTVVEMVVKLRENGRVKFYYPKSGDAIFKVYNTTFLAAHGDRIGSRGGTGFLGATATVLRGIAKTRAYYASQGQIIDCVLVGHFHTTSVLQSGISNGSLIGPSEYSRDLRAQPEQAKQNLIVVHSEKGIISFEQLFAGDQAEGSIYRGT